MDDDEFVVGDEVIWPPGDDTSDLDAIEKWAREALYPAHREWVLGLVRQVREREARLDEVYSAAINSDDAHLRGDVLAAWKGEA